MEGARKRKRRAKGEGTICQRKDGLWMAQATVGINPQTGKPKRRTVYARTQREVAEKLTKILHELQTGTYVEPSKVTTEEWFMDWLERKRHHVEETTWEGYETIIRCHIIPAFAQIKVRDLQPRMIQTFINEKLETGLSIRTVKYISALLNMGLTQAKNERLISFNPMDAVQLPKERNKKERPIWNNQEMNKFLITAAKESKYYVAFALELITGLRRGELLALRWSNVDFQNKKIKVREQLVRVGGKLKFKKPKTFKSSRDICLADNDASGIVLNLLKAHKAHQEEWKKLLRDVYQDNNLVFCTDIGKPLEPKNFVEHFKAISRKARVKEIRFHDLRHTFATFSLENGVNPKTLAEMLGHASIYFSLDDYCHVTPRMREEAATILSESFSEVFPQYKIAE